MRHRHGLASGALALFFLMALPPAAAASSAELRERAEAHCSGTAGRIDNERSRELFLGAAVTGDPRSRFRVAILQTLGACGFDADLPAARRAAPAALAEVEAIKDKTPEDQYLIGASYAFGVGRPEQPAAALPWFQRGAAGGNQWSMFNLGWMYHSGTGVPGDPEVGIDWYEKAARLGNLRAVERVGDAYLGALRGRRRDTDKALEYFRLAAAGNAAGAMTRLGEMHSRGDGVPRNMRTAVEWYRKAAAGGQGLAMYHLAHLHFEGRGVPRDPAAGVQWMESSAEEGFIYALLYMARQSENGLTMDGERLIEPDLERAIYWYQQAAAQGDTEAKGWLAFQKLNRE